jgi:DNA repair exonuclease SbcCD nuclease subunit
VLGDRTGGELESWKIFDKAVSDINHLKPAFVVMIGDVIEGGASSAAQIEARWEEAMSHLASLKIPLFVVPGNNDIWDRTSYSVWRRVMGDTYSAFTYKGCRFILLNTEESYGTGEKGLGARQMAFVEENIRQHGDVSQFFLFYHQPVWAFSGSLKSDWERIESLLEGKIFSVFAGHMHALGSKYRKGHRHLIVGPTGGNMRLPRNPSLGLFHHFTWVVVERDTSSVAFIEPGCVRSERIAQKAYDRYLLGRLLLKGRYP